jgi:hypothetical protein
MEPNFVSILTSFRLPEALYSSTRTIYFLPNTLYPPKAAYDTKFVDDFTCNTDYEPRHVPEASLKAQVISGLKEEGYKESGWKFIIYENLVDKVLVERSHQNGYLDFKYLIYADDTTDDLHLKMSIKKDGPVSLHFHGKVL